MALAPQIPVRTEGLNSRSSMRTKHWTACAPAR